MSHAEFAVERMRKRPIPSSRVAPGGARTGKPWGMMAHTCGSSAVEEAHAAGADVFEHVVEIYRRRIETGPTYVIGYLGQTAAIYEDQDLTWHAGLSNGDGTTRRQTYLSGEWRRLMDTRGLLVAREDWDRRWPKVASPSHLYPSRDPNQDFLGVELTPLVGAVGEPAPAFEGARFTRAQHEAFARLAADRARAWSWPSSWSRSARMLGHEDVDPLTRADAGGLWDPGARRRAPRWSWDLVQSLLPR